MPHIGVVDFYGLHKVREAQLRRALGASEGDLFPASPGDAEERLDQVPGVLESHLEAVCCDQGRTILYIGIEEKGTIHFELREPPDGEVVLPAEITSSYRRFMDSFQAALRRGETGEDLTQGHHLSADVVTRADQEMFKSLADEHLAELRDVLKNSADEDQRAIAAYIIGYEPRKNDIVADLQFALKDSDPGVRANAVEGLLAVAVFAHLHPEAKIRIEPTWFIEMLNSLAWSDRNHALRALQVLSDSRDPDLLNQLRERALASLIEMSRWKTLAHALPALILVGRVGGMTDQQIQTAWTRGDRESVISVATGKKPGK